MVSSRAVGTRRNTLTASEAVVAGARCALQLRFGNQFLERWFFSRQVPPLETLADWSRKHAQHLLEEDLKFFDGHGIAVLVEKCRELITAICAASPQTIFLRLGWGTGWRTMTGDLLDPQERARVIERVGKTRRVILDGHGLSSEPRNLFGWIRIEPAGPDEIEGLLAAAAPPVAPLIPEQQRRGPAEPAPFQQSIDALEQKIGSLQEKDFGRVQSVCEEIARTSGEGRRRYIELIEKRLSFLFTKDKRKLARVRDMLTRTGLKNSG